MAEIERQKVDSYIDTLLDSGFSYKDIESKLLKKSDLNENEVTVILKSKFIQMLKDSIKKYVIGAIVLGTITIVFVVLYYYYQHKQDLYMEKQILAGKATLVGKGKYLVFGNFNSHRIFQTIGGWTGLFTILSLLMIGFTWIKIYKIKKI